MLYQISKKKIKPLLDGETIEVSLSTKLMRGHQDTAFMIAKKKSIESIYGGEGRYFVEVQNSGLAVERGKPLYRALGDFKGWYDNDAVEGAELVGAIYKAHGRYIVDRCVTA